MREGGFMKNRGNIAGIVSLLLTVVFVIWVALNLRGSSPSAVADDGEMLSAWVFVGVPLALAFLSFILVGLNTEGLRYKPQQRGRAK